MSITSTAAAKHVAVAGNDPHKLISLLMAGLLERVEQARQSIDEGRESDKLSYLQKITAIIHGLRASLNFNDGGDIALNLDSLYDYMLSCLDQAGTDLEKTRALDEVSNLMLEIKAGWDAIEIRAA